MRATKLLDMAEELRRRAAEVSKMGDYARKMLDAAAELELEAQRERTLCRAEKQSSV